MLSQAAQSGKLIARSYGTTIAKGEIRQHALKPRGRIPAEPTDYRLAAGAMISLCCWGAARFYASKRREDIKKANYDQMISSNMGPWRDFENRRMPAYAKLLANESPCGDPFKEAYLCSTFGEGSCSEQFESFLGCLKENPVMMRDVKPDGAFNWESKLFLYNLLTEKKVYDDLIASVGPADEDMDDVYSSYKARELLGADATEAQVAAFKEKYNSVREEFWSEVEGLFDGSKTDSSRADSLLKKLIKEYSVSKAAWLQCMKDYDIEEFDEIVTHARRRYGTILKYVDRLGVMKQVRDADLKSVSCGEQFEKMYACMDYKKDQNDCLDVIDELFFCREHKFKEVFPRPMHPDIGVKGEGVRLFQLPEASFKAEVQRPQQIVGYPGLVL